MALPQTQARQLPPPQQEVVTTAATAARPKRTAKAPELFKAGPAPPPAVAHRQAADAARTAATAIAAPAAAVRAALTPVPSRPPEQRAGPSQAPPGGTYQEDAAACVGTTSSDDDDASDVAGLADVQNGDAGVVDDEDEFRPPAGASDVEDDEATLEEEEAAAAAEGGLDGAAEAQALADDADLPIEEVMRRYYGDSAAAAGGANGGSAAHRTNAGGTGDAPLRGHGHAGPAAAAAPQQERGQAVNLLPALPPPVDGDTQLAAWAPHGSQHWLGAQLYGEPSTAWPPLQLHQAPLAAQAFAYASNPYSGAAPLLTPPPPRLHVVQQQPAVPVVWKPPTWQSVPPPPALSPEQAAAHAALCARLAAQREDEDELLLRAVDVRDEARQRAATFGDSSLWETHFRVAEVSRNKTHWDCLLEEMAWLAKDNDRERKLMRKLARKAATACKTSGKDIASKAIAAQHAEQAALRRIASLCAREVRVFWGKAEKLVRLCAQQEADQRRKADMDKHLQLVVAQTERYAALVANQLTSAPGAAAQGGAQQRTSQPAAGAAPRPAGGDADAAHDDDEFAPDDEMEGEEDDEATLEEEEAAAAAAGDDVATELAALAAEQDAPLEQLLPPEVLARYRQGTASEDDEAEGSDEEGESDDDGSVHLSDEDPEDDEGTLAEELAEAAARGEDQPEAAAAELADLQADADLPIEQLLARYGAASGAADAMDVDAAEDDDADASSDAEEDGDDGSDSDDEGQPAWANALLATPAPVAPGASAEEAEAAAEAGRQGLERVAAVAAACAGSSRTPVPFLLRATLRDYQRDGLDWLVALHNRQLNGILADEMGLGKTIQTIALLAHLACARGVWGPHLVVVPTSVMLNWEAEFKRFCPALKLLVYYGTAKERKLKRQGWSKANAFHVCITSYTLVTQDAPVFRRKKWKYLILDEAHMIKNWRSQRWQTLLNFHTQRRLLLTGTPLQNDLMELWSLMHFLMPEVFASHADFRAWFSQPLTASVEGQQSVNAELVGRLHGVLRPFLLRRLKIDVEKGLPPKTEHVIPCSLSKRQRRLYEEYMQCSSVQGTLASGNLMGIMNVLMQLRKVCNHPDLFEGRPIISPLDWDHNSAPRLPALLADLAAELAPQPSPGESGGCHHLPLDGLLALAPPDALPPVAVSTARTCAPSNALIQELVASAGHRATRRVFRQRGGPAAEAEVSLFSAAQQATQAVWRAARLDALATLTRLRLAHAERNAASGTCVLASARGGASLRALLAARSPAADVVAASRDPARVWEYTHALRSCVRTPAERSAEWDELLCAAVFAIPPVRCPPPRPWASTGLQRERAAVRRVQTAVESTLLPALAPLHTAVVRRQVFFPDRRLIQFDCGKLQALAELLGSLKSGGHKCLIFTQMTKMLDILASFLNLYGHTYCRLDGSTKAEQRQLLMQRFNTDNRLFCFILTTRAGGFGLNLTGADTVIFYDSDWNPAMDAQAQDRAHRIGQTRPVRIYRLVCGQTIEENILKKATQKRQLDWMAIQSGHFSTQQLTAQQMQQQPSGTAVDPREFFDSFFQTTASVAAAAAATAAAATAGAAGAHTSAVPTAAELAAAMRGAEDDADVAAAQAEERAQQLEAAEFEGDGLPRGPEGDEGDGDGDAEAAEGEAQEAAAQQGAPIAHDPLDPVSRHPRAPRGPSDDDDRDVDDAPRRAKQKQPRAQADATSADAEAAAAAAAAALAAEEDDMLADIAKVTAKVNSTGGSWLDALSPVERYALQFIEVNMPPVLPFGQGHGDASQAAGGADAAPGDAAAGGDAREEEDARWAPHELAQRKAELEAAAQEEDDHLAIPEWDAEAAGLAYQRQLAAARQAAEEREAQRAALEAQRAAKEAKRAAHIAAAQEKAEAAQAEAQLRRAQEAQAAAAAAAAAQPLISPPMFKVKLPVAGGGPAGYAGQFFSPRPPAAQQPQPLTLGSAHVDLPDSRSGRKRKLPQLPGGNDEVLYAVPSLRAVKQPREEREERGDTPPPPPAAHADMVPPQT